MATYAQYRGRWAGDAVYHCERTDEAEDYWAEDEYDVWADLREEEAMETYYRLLEDYE